MVEYENGVKETLMWGELVCYSVMKRHEKFKDELLAITNIYCSAENEHYLQIPFAVLKSDNEPIPKVTIE